MLFKSFLSLFLSLAGSAITSLATEADMNSVTEGTIPWSLNGLSLNTWYKQFGKITPEAKLPLIVLHGGPGLTSNYLSPFADLATQYNTPVIIYDQLGNGLSTHLDDAPPTFWTIEVFVEELKNVIQHFNIEGAFNLAGHSWGTVLGMEFARRTRPRGLKHLILSDGLASNDLWNESQDELVASFPPWVGEGLAAGFSDPPAFEAALRAFYAVHGIRINPPPADYNATLAWIFGPNADPTVASSPFLNGWSIIGRQQTIQTKTLVINSQFDIAQDFVIRPLVQGIRGAKWVKFQNASHMPFWEQRPLYMKVANDFLSS